MRQKLTKVELDEGVGRLKARDFAADGMQELNDFTGTFVFERAAPVTRALVDRGLDWETANAVVDLAMALVASKLTPERALRLGTSEEAFSLFETRSREWRTALRWRAERACGNVVRFKGKSD
jgi:hypothetical protein